MIKKYDIVATVGTYQKDGETKKEFRKVGVLMEKDGKPFILLERIFNPAGMPADGKRNVLLSLYEPKEENSHNNQQQEQPLDDHIPF